MLITTDQEDFIAKDFVILNFYGTDTCFAWNEDLFVYFNFPCEESTNRKFSVLQAHGPIKDIRCFQDRVFFLSHPTGIFKFSKQGKFANLSKNGIEFGSDYDEVLSISNQMLTLTDKRSKVNTILFPISSTEVPPVHVLRLDFVTTDISLRKALLVENFIEDTHLCIISHGQKIFLLHKQNTQIIYNCDYSIKNIKPVFKKTKVIGMIVQMDANISIFIHVENNKLKYDKIFLGTKITKICAVIDEKNESELLLVYSDGERTYNSKKNFINDSVQKIKTDEKIHNSFQLYQSKFVIYLSSSNVLSQVDINSFKVSGKENNDFLTLDPSMIINIDLQTEMICKKSNELKNSFKKLKNFEDKFKGINMFVKKQCIKYCPKENIVRLSNKTYLVTDFEKTLPENSVVVKMLKNRNKTIFSMKKVSEQDTIVEMPINISNLSSNIKSTTDLISYKNDEGMWCLIKNYVRDPKNRNKFQLSKEKINFIKQELTVLELHIRQNSINMQILAKIKRKIRDELEGPNLQIMK